MKGIKDTKKSTIDGEFASASATGKDEERKSLLKTEEGNHDGNNVEDEEESMMKKFGMPSGFSSTKGCFVPDANQSAVKFNSKRQPRQYMNRRGGFNRPLPAELSR